MKKIGVLKQEIIDLLRLDIEVGTEIFVGQQNIDHMKARHPIDFENYFFRIQEIVDDPDYVRLNDKDNSIDYVKLYQINRDYIQVSVRVSGAGIYYARTLFSLATYKAEKYIEQGTLIPVSPKI